MLSGLLAIKYIEREDSEVVELIDCQTPSTTVDTGLDQLIETNQSQAKSAKNSTHNTKWYSSSHESR